MCISFRIYVALSRSPYLPILSNGFLSKFFGSYKLWIKRHTHSRTQTHRTILLLLLLFVCFFVCFSANRVRILICMGERRNECYLNIGLVSQYPVFWSEKKYETFAVNNEIEKEEEDAVLPSSSYYIQRPIQISVCVCRYRWPLVYNEYLFSANFDAYKYYFII